MRRLILVAALALAGCAAQQSAGQGTTPPPSQTPPGETVSVPPGGWPAGWVLPDPTLTPGATNGVGLANICPHTNPALEAARPGSAIKRQVYAEYRQADTPGADEVDHLIPLELDGANTISNLWPEPNDHPKPGYLNSKDILENYLHAQVCAGRIPLATAQLQIRTDWRRTYVQYLGRP